MCLMQIFHIGWAVEVAKVNVDFQPIEWPGDDDTVCRSPIYWSGDDVTISLV